MSQTFSEKTSDRQVAQRNVTLFCKWKDVSLEESMGHCVSVQLRLRVNRGSIGSHLFDKNPVVKKMFTGVPLLRCPSVHFLFEDCGLSKISTIEQRGLQQC